MTLELEKLTIAEAAAALRRGDFSATDLTEAYLARIKANNKNWNAYLEVFDDALTQAEAADRLLRQRPSEASPLCGIPLAIKDNILIDGRICSAASKILAGYRATYDATVIKKLKAAGAVFLGRTNMDEFAMGGSTENSAFGPTKNPHDPKRVAGGSSGGSAAAVAGDLALAALGSDTGGSIRQPASFCGVVGLKPTYGAVSRSGLMAMASSLDQIGPFAKTVADAEILFNAIAGPDELDSTSAERPNTKHSVSSTLRVGVPRDFLAEGVNPEVLANFNESMVKLKAAGHEVKDIALPNLRFALACYYVIMPAEASTNLARYDGVKYGLHKNGANLIKDYFQTRGAGFGPEVRRRIMLGAFVLSSGYYDAYYARATQVRRLITGDFHRAFEAVDVIALPTTPTPAFKIGEKTEDPLQMYLEDIFTVPANLAGLPAISAPAGKTKGGLPLGLQLLAAPWQEPKLFALGREISLI